MLRTSKIPVVIGRGDTSGLLAKVAKAIPGELIIAKGQNLVPALQSAFRNGRPIVTNISTPIVIRALASVLGNKYHDPPVVVMTYNGEYVTPLLGISHGAASLAEKVAEASDGQQVFSGATSQWQESGAPIDSPPEGYVFMNYNDYKEFAVGLLDGKKVQINGKAPWLDSLPNSPSGELQITVSEKLIEGSVSHLIFAPTNLAIGVGCERGTSLEEVQSLVDSTLASAQLNVSSVACYATIDIKEDEPAVRALAYDQQLRLFSKEELISFAELVPNPSDVVQSEIGVPSVAEASALAAAGPGAELVVTKSKSKRATCAVARAPTPILNLRGRTSGTLSILGIGPGDQLTRSPEVEAALWRASDWVGYSLYLDLVKDAHHQQTRHDFPLGDEEKRCRHAIELAKQGKQVALVCSGDPAIFAMAALVYELIDREPCRIAVEVHPGISAFQMGSARVGALIGHDFCCISLSDLLTPWETIVQRVTAAAEGDFVISFYNPRSLKRTDQIVKAFDILRPHRKPDTPVVLASNLGRPEEKVRIVRFDEFRPEDVDMLTLVMVGSSQSKAFKRGDGQTYAYTPRGYAKKMEPL